VLVSFLSKYNFYFYLFVAVNHIKLLISSYLFTLFNSCNTKLLFTEDSLFTLFAMMTRLIYATKPSNITTSVCSFSTRGSSTRGVLLVIHNHEQTIATHTDTHRRVRANTYIYNITQAHARVMSSLSKWNTKKRKKQKVTNNSEKEGSTQSYQDRQTNGQTDKHTHFRLDQIYLFVVVLREIKSQEVAAFIAALMASHVVVAL